MPISDEIMSYVLVCVHVLKKVGLSLCTEASMILNKVDPFGNLRLNNDDRILLMSKFLLILVKSQSCETDAT
jgi:hypothetical protein